MSVQNRAVLVLALIVLTITPAAAFAGGGKDTGIPRRTAACASP